MRRSLLAILLFMSPLIAVASPLSQLTAAIEALGRYEAIFDVTLSGNAVRGEYRVDGDRYHLIVDKLEFYGESDLRYTIDHTNREVVIEQLANDGNAQLLIVNPTKAFIDLDSIFSVRVLEQDAERVVLRLTPQSGAESLLESTEIEIDAESNLPRRVIYVAEGESVEVTIEQMKKTDREVNVTYPSDYDIIDLRY